MTTPPRKPRRRVEHEETRLPLIDQLVALGWDKDQLLYEPEWRVPKTPSEASRREGGSSFDGFPVDLAIFENPSELGDYERLNIIVETKSPNETAGINQLKIYMGLEPHVLLGVWTNGSDIARVYRTAGGSFVVKKGADLPRPSESLLVEAPEKLTWNDLRPPSTMELRRIFGRLLNVVVARDNKSTRREDQLNHLCNLLLVKLESDRIAKVGPNDPCAFQVWGSEKKTATEVRRVFTSMRLAHSDLFYTDVDNDIALDDHTIASACYELGSFRLLNIPINVISEAFQLFRTASLKSEEGQYYTPYPVIRSAVKFMEIHPSDKLIDPACGTGGFLLESYRQLRERFIHMSDADAMSWAQRHLFGIDKDRINVKLTKAIMLTIGDGSTHVYLGDSIRENLWPAHYPDLVSAGSNEAYTCILTNPPFGKDLTISPADARLAGLTIARKPKTSSNHQTAFSESVYQERQLGLAFLERCHALLVEGGRLGIILPETYFFSSSYAWLQSWLNGRFVLRGMLNIPMEAFQGFCRAKTNFYVFEKVADDA